MRCITLANHATLRGWHPCFVSRDPDNFSINLIQSAGHEIRKLASVKSKKIKSLNPLIHCDWLPVSQEHDAKETLKVVNDFKPDFIVVDHYALDSTWHSILKDNCKKIMVIDDLGDRKLSCDILLDQNLGASPEKYKGKVSQSCRLLLGPQFALLRDEFRDWRDRSLKRRVNKIIEKILITIGGVDAPNYTLKILKELQKSRHAKKCVFTVVVGGSYPHLDILNKFIISSKLKISILVNVDNMASIMTNSDLCIGAAGTTSWERCCWDCQLLLFPSLKIR